MGFDLDFVNLRLEEYTNPKSRVPKMHMGGPAEDAARRDLTINALYYNLHTKEVEDFTGNGLSDLWSGTIRTPQPPLETLLDDPLRSIRVVRFAGLLDFSIDPDVLVACGNSRVHQALIEKVSLERIRSEVFKMLFGSEYTALRCATLLHSSGLWSAVINLSALPTPSATTTPNSTIKSGRNGNGDIYLQACTSPGLPVKNTDLNFRHLLSTSEREQLVKNFLINGVNCLHSMAYINKTLFNSTTSSMASKSSGNSISNTVADSEVPHLLEWLRECNSLENDTIILFR